MPGADDQDIETVGIKADISSPVHLVYAADAAEAPRLFIMSGNTMGSFDPLAEIRYVSQCMKPEDRLIIDGEIFDEKQSMRAARQARGAPFSFGTAGQRRDFGNGRRNQVQPEARRAPRGTAPDHAILPGGDATFRLPWRGRRFRWSAGNASG